MVSVVLPTYNELGNIVELLSRLSEVLKSRSITYELIVVDDDSPDQTWKLVQDYAVDHSEVQIVRRMGERGLTSAINSGIQRSSGEFVAWLDCDLSQPPELLGEMIQRLEQRPELSGIVASRYVEFGADIRSGQYYFQRSLSRILYYLSKLVLGITVRDISSGYIAIQKKALQQVLPLRGDYGEYFIDMLVRLEMSGARLEEVPYSLTNRTYGESKTATGFFGYFRRGMKYLMMIFKFGFLRIFK